MASECESVSIKYTGNGTQVLYTFPFTYMSYDDIVAFIYNETYERWEDQKNKFVFANATTIEFFVAPPTPTDGEPNVWIARNTDLEQMLKEFYPGSAIRAQDLNDNFDQLRLAIQEGRCSLEDALNETVQLSDAYSKFDQQSGAWVAADDQRLASSDAIAARHDAYIGATKPAKPAYEQPGKNWQNTEQCYSTYWNNQANAWVAYVNTGPRGIPGQDGTDGVDGAQGPQGPTGPKGDKGDGLFVTGYIDVPGPPITDGTTQGDVIVDSEGIGWFWETDVSPAAWVSLGSIRGPQGEAGEKGDDGEAATIAVGVTSTGEPGTPATVVNSGSSSKAIFNFSIPKGEKGDPGLDGLGTIRSIRSSSPVTVDVSVNPNSPLIGLDISLLDSLP